MGKSLCCTFFTISAKANVMPSDKLSKHSLQMQMIGVAAETIFKLQNMMRIVRLRTGFVFNFLHTKCNLKKFL